MATRPNPLRADIRTVSDVSAQVVERLTSAGRFGLKVGIFGGVAAEDGTSIADYMLFQEFGTSNGVPESAWFRGSLEANKAKYASMMEAEAARIVAGTSKPEHALTRLGVEMANDLKLSITDKGLVDTGAARNAVAFQVLDAATLNRTGG